MPIAAVNRTAIARNPDFMLMLCFAITVSSLPRKPDITIYIISANVVVFIPPPVLHGDEPINIRKIVNAFPVCVSAVWLIDEKPAVELAITDWNILFKSFLPAFIPSNAAELNSQIKKNSVPNVISDRETISTILV